MDPSVRTTVHKKGGFFLRVATSFKTRSRKSYPGSVNERFRRAVRASAMGTIWKTTPGVLESSRRALSIPRARWAPTRLIASGGPSARAGYRRPPVPGGRQPWRGARGELGWRRGAGVYLTLAASLEKFQKAKEEPSSSVFMSVH